MTERKAQKGARATLIYDGTCPVCAGTVKWIREKEISGSFEMMPCQSEQRRSLHPRVNRAECMKAMHLVLPDGTALVGEQALPQILARIRGYRFTVPLFKLPGAAAFSRIAYRWFADRRYRIAEILAHLSGARRRSAQSGAGLSRPRSTVRKGRSFGKPQRVKESRYGDERDP